MVVVSWKLQYEPLCEIGRPLCPQCHNRAEHVLVKKKRGVKLMFVPVYKGSAGHSTVCTICSRVTAVDNESARLLLLRKLGDEYTRLYASPFMQTASNRIEAARVIHDYTESRDWTEDVLPAALKDLSEDRIRVLMATSVARRLAEVLGISISEAEVIMFEDEFPAGCYVDGDGSVLIDPAEMDRRIHHVRSQAETPKR